MKVDAYDALTTRCELLFSPDFQQFGGHTQRSSLDDIRRSMSRDTTVTAYRHWTTQQAAYLQLFSGRGTDPFPRSTRSSASADRPRDALCQFKSCQLLHTGVNIGRQLSSSPFDNFAARLIRSVEVFFVSLITYNSIYIFEKIQPFRARQSPNPTLDTV